MGNILNIINSDKDFYDTHNGHYMRCAKGTFYSSELKEHFKINHIDSVIVLEKPKLSNYVNEMRTNMSNKLKIDISQISVKATTADYLDSIGKNEAIAAHAISTLEN